MTPPLETLCDEIVSDLVAAWLIGPIDANEMHDRATNRLEGKAPNPEGRARFLVWRALHRVSKKAHK